MIQFGNNVSRKTKTTTRRSWKPNVLSKSLYSVVLKKRIKLRITKKVLKTLDREGGLDEYLLKQCETRIKQLGPIGWALRWTLLQRPEVVNRLRAEAKALGIPQEDIDRQWPEKIVADKAALAAIDAISEKQLADAGVEVLGDATEPSQPAEGESNESDEWTTLANTVKPPVESRPTV